jgi:hypothetical protein
MIPSFKRFSEISRPISSLDPQEEIPMVEGIAEILRGVRDLGNRRELAEKQVKDFRRDGIQFDYEEFFRLCDL